VVFAGSTVDIPYIRSITERTKKHAVVAAGKLTLAESTALIEASDVYVGVDSGPMHIAAFAGTPVVAIFGPTDPAKVGPYGEGHRVIRHDGLDCLACRKRSCDDHRCLHEITHQRVFDVTMELLHW
jgi:ADP-heptose:LPS heptosyltransferase